MATITLGVAASHSTLMNTHADEVVHTERANAFRDALGAVNQRLREIQPDVAVIVGSNHFRGFWLDLIPSFTLGVGEVIASGESGTPKGPQKTDPTVRQPSGDPPGRDAVTRSRSPPAFRSTTASRTRSSTCSTASTCRWCRSWSTFSPSRCQR